MRLFLLQIFPNDREFRDGAIEAGEVVWKSGLVKKVGLADGIDGNAYALLSLFHLTGESVYRERAEAFASYLCHIARNVTTEEGSKGLEVGYSLFEGVGGAACLFFDMLKPDCSRFPGYEL